MLLKTFLISCGLILVLSNCARTPDPEVVVQTQYIERNIPIQARPKPVQLVDVQWYVVTEENLDQFLERFANENGPIAFMAISVRGYENLSLNVQDLRRYINQQDQLIIYYENMALESNNPA